MAPSLGMGAILALSYGGDKNIYIEMNGGPCFRVNLPPSCLYLLRDEHINLDEKGKLPTLRAAVKRVQCA